MGTLFIASFFLLGLIVLVLYRQHRASSSDESASYVLPPERRFNGLFAAGGARADAQVDAAASQAERAARRADLLARASAGQPETLAEASGDSELYDEVLTALVQKTSGSDAALLRLASYITRSEEPLRVNGPLAEALMENWRRKPGRAATAKMLHLVALVDDAALYARAVELVLESWRAGRVPELSGAELRAVAEGEYWLLSSRTRSSGAGFVLKRTLASLRREVEGA